MYSFLFSLVMVMLPVYTLAVPTSSANDTCAMALEPTIEDTRSDYRAMQAYLKEHAEKIYDEFRNMTQEQREANASYKVASAEYHDSKSAEEFKKRINERMQRENFQSSTEEAKSFYKRYLTDEQLTHWVKCLQILNNRPQSVQLTPRNITEDSFVLRVDIMMAKGQIHTTMTIQIVNGTIAPLGRTTSSATFKKEISAADHYPESFVVRPLAGKSAVRVIINVSEPSITPDTDDILVSLAKSTSQPDYLDYLAQKWATHRNHITHVFKDDNVRRDYYGSVLKQGSRYLAVLNVQQKNPDAVKHIKEYGAARTERLLLDHLESDPYHLSCTSPELKVAQLHLQYVQDKTKGKPKYDDAKQSGKTKLEATKAAQIQSPDAIAWIEIVDKLGCFEKLTPGLD